MYSEVIIPTIIDKAYAANVLTSDETNIADAATVIVGSITYRFKNTMAQAYDVKRGADAATSLANLVKAINGTGTEGTEYYAGTEAHPLVSASAVVSFATTLTALDIGYAGNSLVTTGATHLTFATATMAGGVGGNLIEKTINGDSNGDAVYSNVIDVGQYFEAMLFLNVTAHAGTSPTLDIKVQASPDGENFVDIGDAMTQVTETNSLTFKRLTDVFGKYIRLVVTTGGTSPSYTLSLYLVVKG